MKKFKFISLMVCCLAAMSFTFTSCDDDDDDYQPLTPTEVQTAFLSVRGDYTGKVYYPVVDYKKNTTKTDSAVVAWSIQSDSVLTIRNFPVSALGVNITDSTVRKEVMAQAPQNIRCAISFIRTTPATFTIAPTTVELSLNYGGKDHKVQIPFQASPYYSYGQNSSNGKGTLLQVIQAGIYEDGKLQQNWLSKGVPFEFISNSKI